jgi:hypothetical protein
MMPAISSGALPVACARLSARDFVMNAEPPLPHPDLLAAIPRLRR